MIPSGLPPGTILQLLYLTERLASRPPGTFIEIGTGGGGISRLLLERGWCGTGYDVHEPSVARTAAVNAEAIAEGRFEVRHGDWLRQPADPPADLVISSMVIEHLPEDEEAAYLRRAHETLRPGGLLVLLVPASPRHWGIEDDIAGHQRRYTRDRLRTLFATHGFGVNDIAGLTFPLSNVVLPLSNWLVARRERALVALTPQERTALSGDRDVMGKTRFPSVAKLLLNPVALAPFHWWQKAAAGSERALVMYAEGECLKQL